MSISTNVVSVIFGNSRRACGDRILHQRDRGQILTFTDLADQLPSTFQVWFANHPEIGTAVPQTGSGGNVAIPDTLVATGQPIWAWLYLHTGADDGETCYTVTILNTAQPAFTGATPTPAQASAWDEAIDAMNAAIEAAEAAANHGPQIVDGFWYTWDAAAGEYVNTNVPAEGEDGADGNSIWWTVSLINDESMPGLVLGKILSSWLKGRSGTPAVHDLVVGPAVGTSGSIEWLYEIIAVSGIYCNLKGIGSIKGAPGDPGADGYAPEVTIEQIDGGHRVTITSAAHPEGQSFDVMDGSGGGAPDNPFYATYGSTTGAEVESAYQAGKSVQCVYGGRTYVMNYRQNSTKFYFTSADRNNLYYLSLSENSWSNVSTKAVGTYTKPSGGIPKTDLAASVQESLDKADNALPKSGGTMSGPVDMGGSKISNLAPGVNDADAVTLAQMSSAISQSAAYFRGSFATRAALLAVAWQTTNPAGQNYVTNNDYAVVLDDETQNDECWRYLYVSGTGWTAQYKINETPLTQAQLDALNSGATASKISAIAGKITAPASANVGDFLVYTANGWEAQSLSVWQGGNYGS